MYEVHVKNRSCPGDGGEDICCRLEERHINSPTEEQVEGANGAFPAEYIDSFVDSLKCYVIEGLVFPRLHMDTR